MIVCSLKGRGHAQCRGVWPCTTSECQALHGNDHAFLSTLHASDSFAKPFKIFVQIWLCEKLNLLEDVDWNWEYTP